MSDAARAAEVWRIRERTEHEAAALFRALASDMRGSDAPRALAEMAARCADDEIDHARRCRAIVAALSPELEPLAPDPHPTLACPSAEPADRAAYAAVAIGCITESLSTALLIEMRSHARVPPIPETVRAILVDEVRHSRVGWAYLAFAAERRDLGWLAAHVPAMLDAALPDEGATAPTAGLPEYGILSSGRAAEICAATIESTILPGLARFGVVVGRR